MKSSKYISINGEKVAPGKRATIDLPVAKLYTHANLSMPVHVINGKKSGPQLFISGAIHGDEINGVEIIRRLLKLPIMKRIRGGLIAIPIVNVHGFINRSRYLPDRRDLNRSFPGSDHGSLAGRIAQLFIKEIASQCNYGIDLHTAAVDRCNLPHIRANMNDEETAKLAKAFGTPVILAGNFVEGSLRKAMLDLNIPTLLYEAGEALRFDEITIRAGVKGILNVMAELGMFPPSTKKRKRGIIPAQANSNYWVRAPESGILRAFVPLGGSVKKNEVLGVISNPFGEQDIEIISYYDGIILGKTNLPLVHEGEALFHIARFERFEKATAKVDKFQETFQPDTSSILPEEENIIV
ncbi:MAG: succinylglutamate desuccinylase/aspartoacylase family protein [Nitrospinae bacterium]|nr:succinylglutamate desuccinylase/aspartoacylase family protein [Nitrospinota bacterium]